jgi:chaperonin GroEL (HSP60 family)
MPPPVSSMTMAARENIRGAVPVANAGLDVDELAAIRSRGGSWGVDVEGKQIADLDKAGIFDWQSALGWALQDSASLAWLLLRLIDKMMAESGR